MKLEKLEKITKMLHILGYILTNPNCTMPEIRDFLEIKHEFKISPEEKELYSLVAKLEREEYIYKFPIKKKGSGGIQFRLRISNLGFVLLSQFKSKLRDFFPMELKKEDGLVSVVELDFEKIIKVFGGEVYDIIEDTIEKILQDTLIIQFQNINFPQQQQIINSINRAASRIKDRTEQIAKIFFPKP